jgi:hypothetical protein
MSLREFKFFADNNIHNYEDSPGASWMWVSEEYMTEMYGERYSVDTIQCRGISSFLSEFIPNTIVKVKSITGPLGLIHNMDNDGIGWDFDITSELITIVYFTIHDENI